MAEKSVHTINRDRKSNIIGAIWVRERKAKKESRERERKKVGRKEEKEREKKKRINKAIRIDCKRVGDPIQGRTPGKNPPKNRYNLRDKHVHINMLNKLKVFYLNKVKNQLLISWHTPQFYVVKLA